MANVTYRCPYCEQTARSQLVTLQPLNCALCGRTLTEMVPEDVNQTLETCLVCNSHEMFVRKDFPQRLGVTIVLTGFAISIFTWYHHWVLTTFAVLFLSALIDVVLYVTMGNVLECYRCKAQYRGIGQLESHDPFNLEIHERYRQQAARMDQVRALPRQHSAERSDRG